MKVKDIMTQRPLCCSPLASLKEAAQMMYEGNCGQIIVVENFIDLKPIGILTDRDLGCRTLALGLNPLELTVGECMSRPYVVVHPYTPLEDCYRIMKEYDIQCLPVVNEEGHCCGMVSQADLAVHHLKGEIHEVLEQLVQR